MTAAMHAMSTPPPPPSRAYGSATTAMHEMITPRPPPIVAGLIVLMAQMGCYVPAELAVIPVRDRLLSRIGTGDDMENNVSTFLMEMREVSQVRHTIG